MCFLKKARFLKNILLDFRVTKIFVMMQSDFCVTRATEFHRGAPALSAAMVH